MSKKRPRPADNDILLDTALELATLLGRIKTLRRAAERDENLTDSKTMLGLVEATVELCALQARQACKESMHEKHETETTKRQE